MNALKTYLNQFKEDDLTLTDIENYLKINNAPLYSHISTFNGYLDFVTVIRELIEEGVILPDSDQNHTNFKEPALPVKYKVLLHTQANAAMNFDIAPLNKKINTGYFLKNQQEYNRFKEHIRKINTYLNNPDEYNLTVTERSYKLFNDERFLESPAGSNLIRNLGLTLEDLDVVKTYEPFHYVINKDAIGSDIIILETRDAFWSFKRLIEESGSDIPVCMIIYGEGKKIETSLEYLYSLFYPENAQVYYFSSIDKVNIDIFHCLVNIYSDFDPVPHVRLYGALIALGKDKPLLITGKKEQIDDDCCNTFIDHFENDDAKIIRDLISANRYIPQAAIHYVELRRAYNLL